MNNTFSGLKTTQVKWLWFNAIFFKAHRNELRDYCFNNTQQRKFLFAALRRFVLGAARLVVVRLVGCLRRNGLAGCWKWQRVVRRVREVFIVTV